MVVDPTMTREANGEAMFEIIKPLAKAPPLVMGLGGDVTADLTLDMVSEEGQPQAAVLPQPGRPDLAHAAQPGFGFELCFPFQW
jgi:hypothetical protein